ncbi:hydroxymethylglutaryl-CoA lyase [Dyadobacter sandarakinus]|uniref:Hydroxymethylglutaryl-CoA lyase n=1 Tax=Dyadobacter sandarakinus TaxID=2747268 RepID=A0ABX7I840_9BACT|nr:hydroxymethylglutaryl-CoA lyase [Dyadobacter sandarakinus]QRR02259.1 hydroxymethylglutaryl-CoA lyase [Dyadobacter sandarakinus]
MVLTECPRDAWQGFHAFIPTADKVRYLNQLLQVGFDMIDFGSFVSPKVVAQVRDTAEIADALDMAGSGSCLLAIVANERGAREACAFRQITHVGYPFSVSETFQKLNTNAGIAASLQQVESIAAICQAAGKELVIYISMGFGNPYGDIWHPELVLQWIDRLSVFHVKIFSLADTVGVAREEDIRYLFTNLISSRPGIAFGAHFHSTPLNWKSKLEAAYQAGCRRFDGALLGYGGCPMAQDELVGNMATENLVAFAKERGELLSLDLTRLEAARSMFRELVAA